MKLKLLTISAICLIATACTANTSTVHHEKIQTVNLHKQSGNILIASTDLNKQNSFKDIQQSINDFDVNTILKNALDHNLLDKNAFSENVIVTPSFDQHTNVSASTATLTPSVTMSADYSTVNVTLTTSTAINGKRTYSPQKKVGHGSSSENKQHLLNHPIPLKEDIINALYEVAQQFADDTNNSYK